MQTNQLAALAGEGEHTAQGAEKGTAVYCGLTWIVGRNYRVVVRISSVYQSAVKYSVVVFDLGISVVELDKHVTAVLGKNVLQQVGWFLGKIERSRSLACDREVLVAYQLMAVACYNGECVGG